tara:strand:- start:496 stop:1206 length:711 start_codon:yes stop_codon:yes gene_type:complete
MTKTYSATTTSRGTKGSALTYTEMDNNINTIGFLDSDVTDLKSRATTLEANNPQQSKAGQILETIEALADGTSVTVQSGTYTFTDVTTEQVLANSIASINGSSISYVPPAGTTRVIYEFYVFLRELTDGRILAHFRGRVDGTNNNQARHTVRDVASADLSDGQMWVYNKMILTIGQVGSDDIANGKLASYNTARTLDFTARRYSSNYESGLHMTNQWNGTGDDVLVKPHIRITAIG